MRSPIWRRRSSLRRARRAKHVFRTMRRATRLRRRPARPRLCPPRKRRKSRTGRTKPGKPSSGWPTSCTIHGGGRSRRGSDSTEARRILNEVAEEIARNLRETDPRPDRPATTEGAAAELAGRLNGTADKQARVIAALEAMEPEPCAAAAEAACAATGAEARGGFARSS